MPGLLRRLAPCLLLAGLFAVSAGCSARKGTVSGKVTVEGKPLQRGLITFLSQVGNKEAANAAIIDGKYETGEILAGPTKVVIAHGLDQSRGAEGPEKAKDRGDALPQEKRNATAQTVPDKYMSADSSGLEFTVKPGTNEFSVDLKW
jgi:hypothetical protein